MKSRLYYLQQALPLSLATGADVSGLHNAAREAVEKIFPDAPTSTPEALGAFIGLSPFQAEALLYPDSPDEVNGEDLARRVELLMTPPEAIAETDEEETEQEPEDPAWQQLRDQMRDDADAAAATAEAEARKPAEQNAAPSEAAKTATVRRKKGETE